MNPDQSLGAVWPGSILFAKYTSKVYEQACEWTTTVMNDGKSIKLLNWYWFCLFPCFTSQSTAMVITGWSVHLTTLVPGQA